MWHVMFNGLESVSWKSGENWTKGEWTISEEVTLNIEAGKHMSLYAPLKWQSLRNSLQCIPSVLPIGAI